MIKSVILNEGRTYMHPGVHIILALYAPRNFFIHLDLEIFYEKSEMDIRIRLRIHIRIYIRIRIHIRIHVKKKLSIRIRIHQ